MLQIGLHELVLQSTRITWVNIHMQLCIYIYIYTCTRMFAYMYIHVYTCTHGCMDIDTDINLAWSATLPIAGLMVNVWQNEQILSQGWGRHYCPFFSVCLHNWANHTQYRNIIPDALHQAYIMITNKAYGHELHTAVATNICLHQHGRNTWSCHGWISHLYQKMSAICSCWASIALQQMWTIVW